MDFRYKRPVITQCQIDKNLVLDESKQINVLIQMKNDNKSDDTVTVYSQSSKLTLKTFKPFRTRISKSLHSTNARHRQLQTKPLHSLQQILQVLPNRMENAILPTRSQNNQTAD